jgi:hypothetical protein
VKWKATQRFGIRCLERPIKRIRSGKPLLTPAIDLSVTELILNISTDPKQSDLPMWLPIVN